MHITSIPYTGKLNHIEISEDAAVYVDTVIPNDRFGAILGAMIKALIRKIFNKPIRQGFLQ